MPPRSLDIGFELTNLCNLHCIHCIRGSHQATIDRLDLAFVRDVIDQAQRLFDNLEVVFTGGEPLASELFSQAVEEVATCGISYRFVTNGWLLPKYIPLLVRFKPRLVRVSLSGASSRTHDAQRGAGSFRRALLGVAILQIQHIRAELSMVLTRDSRSELEEAARLAEQLGVPELHFILPQPTPETIVAGSDLSPAEWKSVAGEVFAIAGSSGVDVRLDYGSYMPLPTRLTCSTLQARQLYIDALGRAIFCCQLARYGNGPEPVIGDLRAESLADVIVRSDATYGEFVAETVRMHAAGEWDEMDDFPCLSCARRHGRTGFLRDSPEHPWAMLARSA